MKNAKRIMEFAEAYAQAAYTHGYEKAHDDLLKAGFSEVVGAQPKKRKRISERKRNALMQALGMAAMSRVPQVYLDAFKEKKT